VDSLSGVHVRRCIGCKYGYVIVIIYLKCRSIVLLLIYTLHFIFSGVRHSVINFIYYNVIVFYMHLIYYD